ncbi:MAG: iron-sulfur cluster assembly protein [Anaerolineaceae bacterium]|jgi:metal-sulfur cluster biosynthetic enzyme|nr:iron-sulfur cluster assembly protein [Anaerolineaceae bacterium]
MEKENNNTQWQLENTNPELANLLRKSLRQVIDPELGLDVIALGLIRDANEDGEEINVRMILTTPFCPYGPAMINEVTETAEAAIKRPVIVELGMEPWDKNMLEDGIAADWGLF